MPILDIRPDPYAADIANAVGSFTSAMGGGGIEARAKAQVLAAQMAKANMEQQHLAQTMRLEQQKRDWELQDRTQKLALDAQEQQRLSAFEDAAGKYWGTRPPRPVGVNGAEPTQDQLNDWYTSQNYFDQFGRRLAHQGKDATDTSKGFDTFQGTYQSAYPASAGSLPGMTPDIAANPDARKKYAETFAHDAAKTAAGSPAQIASANETLVKLQNAENAYRGLRDQGEIGPWAGGVVGQTWDKYGFGNQNAAGLREAYTAAANQLQLELARINFAGQGAVTENERKILAQTLPMLNNSDPERALQLLQQMRETAQRVIQRQQAIGGRGYGAPQGAPRRQPSPQHVQMLLEGLRNGDPSVAQEFADEFGPDALRAAMGGR